MALDPGEDTALERCAQVIGLGAGTGGAGCDRHGYEATQAMGLPGESWIHEGLGLATRQNRFDAVRSTLAPVSDACTNPGLLAFERAQALLVVLFGERGRCDAKRQGCPRDLGRIGEDGFPSAPPRDPPGDGRSDRACAEDAE